MIDKLKFGEHVTFKRDNGEIIVVYQIRSSFLNARATVNSKIFDVLGLDASKFCAENYGYVANVGSFPCYEENDYDALYRLLMELSTRCVVEINGTQWRNRKITRTADLIATHGTSTYGQGFIVHSPDGIISRADSSPSLAQIKREISITVELTFKETTMSYIQDKFAALMLTEPTKSFKKLGLLTDRNHLNEDGKELFIQYLLSVHGDAFKKDVVDVLLKEEEKKK